MTIKTCIRCGGTGYITLPGPPPSEGIECPSCRGDGITDDDWVGELSSMARKAAVKAEVASVLAAELRVIINVHTVTLGDILDKCLDIKEKVDETKEVCDSIWNAVKP